jgi:cytoskeletal protein RodZ
MHAQDMELDPLRMAQINGPVSPGNTYIPSYAAFPAARFTDNRPKIETQAQKPVSEEKNDKGKCKEVERHSALKKPKAEIPEINGNNEKATQQSEPGKGIKPTDGAPRMKSSDGIVAQVKARSRADRDTRVEAQAPPSRKENEKPSTSGGPSNSEVSSRPMSSKKISLLFVLLFQATCIHLPRLLY